LIRQQTPETPVPQALLMFYLVMCLQLLTLTWAPASGIVHNTSQLCLLERMKHSGRCRCEPYVTVLEQRGDQ
jgi:hypothetical protein